MTKRQCQYCQAELPWFAFLVGWHTCTDCAYRRAHGGQPMTPEGRRRIEAELARMKAEMERDPVWKLKGQVDEVWAAKQALAHPSRYYGEGGTIHGTTELDVETDSDGNVVAVWYRCQMLPFKQRRVSVARAVEMSAMLGAGLPKITGVEVLDQ